MSQGALSNEDDVPVDEVDAVGVIAALERTCELEGRLRQALQASSWIVVDLPDSSTVLEVASRLLQQPHAVLPTVGKLQHCARLVVA